MPNEIRVKSILNKTKRRDPWFLDDYTINPYSGCSFNCLYCYTRGSKYGINIEERVSAKINSLQILDHELHKRAKKGKYGIIVLSSATDPYLHFENEYRLTRKILELILEYRFPVHMITKSELIERDFDLLKEINKQAILPEDLRDKVEAKVFITFSFSTTSDLTGKIFEPGATLPTRRLKAITSALNAGFLSGVSLMPLLPFITDTAENLEAMYKTFSELKVKYIFPASLTLFGNGSSDSKTLTLQAVEKYFPHLIESYWRLFGDDIRVLDSYRMDLRKKTDELNKKFGIQNSIL